MSTYYYLYDPKEKSLSPVFHAQQTWGSWTSESADVTLWLEEHRHNSPYVVDEHSEVVYDDWEKKQIAKNKT